jgi:N-acetylglucosaminyl-diphospho-decaprenol L-rhamnosyltransferase
VSHFNSLIPDLVISIINHSNPDMLRDCVRSIYETTRGISFEIYVVDNATDGRLIDDIKTAFPQVRWLMNSTPMGFSANHNRVLSTAAGRYVCILNDDTLIQDGAMESLVQYLDANPKVGLAGPRLLNRDGSIQTSTFRAKTLLRELYSIAQLPGPLNHLKTVGVDNAQLGNQPALVDWLLGACLVIRRQTLDEVGLLDDVMSPIANCEEVDWCSRIHKAGWDVAFVPQSRVTHFGGQSLKNSSPGPDSFRIEMHRATIAFFRKQHGLISSLILRLIYAIALPWNGVMLGQSVLRSRMSKAEAASVWATLVGIAKVAMTPLAKPYCRQDWPESPGTFAPLPSAPGSAGVNPRGAGG